MYRKTIFTAVSLLLTVATGCPATAQQITRVVSFQDLNLTTPDGVETLHRRISHAINFVCRRATPGDSLLKHEDQDCRKEVSTTVIPEMTHAIKVAQSRAAATQFATR